MLMQNSKKIYCDEAGFTGANLFDANQPIFTFASTDIEENRAKELLDETIPRFRIQNLVKGNGELKGGELAQRPRGQEALKWLFGECKNNFYVTTHNKLFAIAAKFFDITFEPLIADYNTFFFRTKFHRFVVTAIYLELLTKNQMMLDAVQNFHTVFQARSTVDGSVIKTTVDKMTLSNPSAVENILLLWRLNERKILAEYDRLSDKSEKINKWTLELSMTSLNTALNYWGTKHKQITPVCDDSTPLSELQDVINILGGQYNFDESYMPTFNGATVNPVEFGKSHENPSIQIADLVASAFNYAVNNLKSDFTKTLFENFSEQISEDNIIPDTEDFNLKNEQAVKNYLMLLAIIKNSKENGGLILSPEFMGFLHQLQSSDLPNELQNLGVNE